MLHPRKILVPKFVLIGKNLLDDLDRIISCECIVDDNIMLISGNGATSIFCDHVASSLRYRTSKFFTNDNDLQTIVMLERSICKYNPSLIIGIGGGRVLDLAKFLSHRTQRPFVAVPTALSNDGLSSPVAVIRLSSHKESIGTHPPVGIVVDIDIIKTESYKTFLSGVGDLISNISALEDWKLSNEINGEPIDRFSEILAINAAERFISHILRQDDNFHDDRTITLLAEGLVQSGISMSFAGSSRPCSGAEHLISHALDRILQRPHPHGIQVGLASLFTLALRRFDFQEILSIYRKLKFPLQPRQLLISKEKFMNAVKIAPTTRRGRFTILDVVSSCELNEAWKIAYSK